MKILDEEERAAHRTHIAIEGVRGAFFGLGVSAVFFLAVKKSMPQRFSTFNHSIKTCMFVMPSVAIAAYWADQGSVEFDRRMYQADQKQEVLEEYRRWNLAGVVGRACILAGRST